MLKLFKVVVPRAIAATGTLLLTFLAPLIVDVDAAGEFLLGFSILYLLGMVSRGGLDIVLLRAAGEGFYSRQFRVSGGELAVLGISFFVPILIGLVYIGFVRNYGAYDWLFLSLPAFSMVGMISFWVKGGGAEIWGALTEVGIISLVASVIVLGGVLFSIEVGLGSAFVVASWGVLLVNIVLILFCYRFSAELLFDVPWKEAFEFFGGQIVSYLTQWYPVFLLGFLSPVYVVYFSLANRLGTVLVFAGSSIDSFAAPRFSAYCASNDLAAMRRFRDKLSKVSRISAGIGFVLIFSAAVIYGLIHQYDNRYYIYSTILLTCYTFVVAMGPNGYLLMMTGSGRYVFMNSLRAFLLLLVLSSSSFFVGSDIFMVASVGCVVLGRQWLLLREASRFVRCMGVVGVD